MSAVVSCSGEVAVHHLDRHSCRSTGFYRVETLECDEHSTFARVVHCEVCDDPLLLRVEGEACGCVPPLLELLNHQAAA